MSNQQIAERLTQETGFPVSFNIYAGMFYVSRGVTTRAILEQTAEAVLEAWEIQGRNVYNRPDTSTDSFGKSYWNEQG